MLIAFLILTLLAAGFAVWGLVVTNGSGSADQRLGGAYAVGIAFVFGVLAALVGFIKLVMLALA